MPISIAPSTQPNRWFSEPSCTGVWKDKEDMTDKLGQFNTDRARDTQLINNQMQQAQALIRTSDALRLKYHDLITGKATRAVQVFKDPSRKTGWIKLQMKMVDGAVQHVWTMNDSVIWNHCAALRKQDDEDRKNKVVLKEFGMQWFKSTFLLELYLLLRYGIDLRSQECLLPTTQEGKELNWIMDHDDFAMRYKTTNMRETVGAANPFRKYH